MQIIIYFCIFLIFTKGYQKNAIYVGMSYHAINGDPNSYFGYDPGIINQIIGFTYKKNKTTSDGKFIIPDQIISQQISQCSFTPKILLFKGSLSYQKNLHKNVNVSSPT